MENKELLKHLNSLIQLDIDAVFAYDQAIEKIGLKDVKNQLESFKSDHERHISELSSLVTKYGGEPPERSKDFKGYFIEGFTSLRSATGTEGALKAMQGNEKLTNKNYGDAMNWEVPQESKDVIQRGYDDERRHLQYIEQCINDRVWKREERKTA